MISPISDKSIISSGFSSSFGVLLVPVISMNIIEVSMSSFLTLGFIGFEKSC